MIIADGEQKLVDLCQFQGLEVRDDCTLVSAGSDLTHSEWPLKTSPLLANTDRFVADYKSSLRPITPGKAEWCNDLFRSQGSGGALSLLH